MACAVNVSELVGLDKIANALEAFKLSANVIDDSDIIILKDTIGDGKTVFRFSANGQKQFTLVDEV